MNEQDFAMLLQRKESLIQETDSLSEQLHAMEAQMERLRVATASINAPLSKANASLSALSEHVDALKKCLDTLNDAKAKLNAFASLKSEYDNFVKAFLNIIGMNKRLLGESRFDESLELLKQTGEMVERRSFGTDSKVLLLAKEIIIHQKADSYAAKGLQRLELDEDPLSAEEQNEYTSLVNCLTCDFIDPADKAKHLCLVKRFYLAELSSRQEATIECLDEDIAAYEDYAGSPDLSHEEADGYAELIRASASSIYNELFAQAVEDSDEETALALFQRRRPFLEPLPEFVEEAEDEEALKRLLVIERCKRMDSAEFHDAVLALSSAGDEESLESLACIMSIEDLEATKKNILVKNIEKWSFDQKAKLYALTMKKGLPVEQSEALYADLLQTKPCKSVLEKAYQDLLFLRFACPEKMKSKYLKLLKGLTRSPKAKRAKTKSKDKEFRLLFRKPECKDPIGKPLKKQMAYRYWSGGMAFLYILGILILPLAVAGAAVYAIFFMNVIPEPVSYFEYAFPAVPLFIALCVFLIQRFGNDERAPTTISKIATILSIPLFGIALAYHFLPTTLSMFEAYIGSMILGGFLLLLLLVAPFKDKSKVWRFLIPSLSAAIGIAATVFFVLGVFF